MHGHALRNGRVPGAGPVTFYCLPILSKANDSLSRTVKHICFYTLPLAKDTYQFAVNSHTPTALFLQVPIELLITTPRS